MPDDLKSWAERQHPRQVKALLDGLPPMHANAYFPKTLEALNAYEVSHRRLIRSRRWLIAFLIVSPVFLYWLW